MIHLTSTRITREVAPPLHRTWMRDQEDERAAFTKQLDEWTAEIKNCEALFVKHVYENQAMNDFDLRQHRSLLYWLLAVGEELAMDFLAMEVDDGAAIASMIDIRLDEFRATLHAWHGEVEQQADVPESFKRAVKDVAAGRLVDMETIMREEA